MFHTEPNEINTSLGGLPIPKIIVNGRYKLLSQIGSGSFGDIFIGMDQIMNKKVAIKLESTNLSSQLNIEWKLYCHLALNNPAFTPAVYYYGTEGDYNILVMDLLGPSLETLFTSCSRQFSLKTTLMLADEMIGQLEYVHGRGVIHRDVKPDNFLMGLGKQNHHVFLIDYGLSRKYYNTRNRAHMDYSEGNPMMGTLRYCSVNTHLGIKQVRRDDLEALGYILVYFMKGSLPWQGLQNPNCKIIAQHKMSTTVDVLCEGLPTEFISYINYTRALKFKETPNYAYLRNLFRWLFSQLRYSNDYVYDWMLRQTYENARREEWERLNQAPNKPPKNNSLVKNEVNKTEEELAFICAS
ncbi:unnamed protein product [Phytomonas sp. EM1]|nr:unnamed protein product [Phytomonas sp. EM1]|eukprot:CCW62336.1 unnamed protein product [Phytomonas sp. isolate EM1]